MRVLVLVVCLLALQAKAFNEEYEIKSKSLSLPSAPFGQEAEENLKERPGRIINGFRATNGQYPWSTRLSIATPDGNYACTGSIIHESYLLSAYHCVDDEEVTAIQFAFGTIDRTSRLVQYAYAENFWYIEQTNFTRPDIAIFRTFEPITFNPNTQPIRLPSSSNSDFSYEGWTSTIMGFGLGNDGRLSNYLQFGHFMLKQNEECNFVYYEVCAIASPNLETSTQGGDSGGPWIVYENNVPTLVGIHWGRRYNETTNMHRATRVTSFLGFISEVSGLEF